MGQSQICDNLSVSFADSIPTPFVPSGHFPLIGGIGPWKGSLGAPLGVFVLLWYNHLKIISTRGFLWLHRDHIRRKSAFAWACSRMYEPTDGNNPSKPHKIGPFFLM